MTLDEANEYLANPENEYKIFTENTYGIATYAAVIIHPEIPYEYAIEIGLNDDINFTYTLRNIKNNTIDLIKHVDSSILDKIQIDYNLISKEFNYKEILNSIDLTKEEIEAISKSIFREREISIEELNNIGFSKKDSQQIYNEEIKFNSKTGQIKKLHLEKAHIGKQKYLEGGISISGNEDLNISGTLGGIFKMNDNDDNLYAITNSHVLKSSRCNEYENAIMHPSRSDTNSNSLNIGRLYWKLENEHIDAAVIKLSSNQNIGNFTRCNKISFKTPIEPSIGASVKKCGRTSGYTEGIIKSINATVYIHEHKQFFRQQIMSTSMAMPGDSGSLLVNLSNHVLGLIFAQSENDTVTFSNHFKKIIQNNHRACGSLLKFKKFINFKNK